MLGPHCQVRPVSDPGPGPGQPLETRGLWGREHQLIRNWETGREEGRKKGDIISDNFVKISWRF